MTPEEFKAEMEKIHNEGSYDPEAAHCDADDLMARTLAELGYSEGVAIFGKLDKWYA